MGSETLAGFTLSPQQERLWTLDGGDRGSPLRAQCLIELAGRLDAARLRAALGEAVARHEILRTRFLALPGMRLPLQVVEDAAAVSLDFAVCDLAGGEDPEALARALGDLPPEDAGEAPPRVRLLRSPAGGDRVLVDLPALCADALGVENLVRELALCYTAAIRGEIPPAPRCQFADLAEWQHEILGLADSRQGLEHWRRVIAALSGAPAGLPFELPRGPEARFTPRSHGAELAAGTAAAIDRLAAALGRPPAAFYLAVWQLLLARLARQGGQAVAVCFDGRCHEELGEAIGLFARYLPLGSLDTEIDVGLPFERVWDAAARAMREDGEWQECFAASLVGATAAAPPWPAFGFDYATTAGSCSFGDVAGTVTLVRARLERFVLRLSCMRRETSVTTAIDYDAARIAPGDAERLMRWLHTLLHSAASRPEAAAGDLALLAHDELHRLRSGLDGSRRHRPATGVHDLFVRRAAATPDAVACAGGDDLLSYGELRARASRMARRLARRGVGPDRLVGVFAERSLDLIVALLGILEAGGAYLPLDPAYPPDHLAALLAQAVPQVVVTQDELRARLPATGAEVLRLGVAAAPAGPAGTPAVGRVDPDNLAYVIHTSGSTGRPKGVMISHRAILNRLLWMPEELGLGPGDRVLWKTQLSFDASVWEIFAPLLAGATVVIARPGGHRDAAYLVREIRERQVTVLQLVPSMLRVWLREPDLEGCTSLRLVCSGGEALPALLAEGFHARLGARLVNLYGPTEVAIDACSGVAAGGGGREGGEGSERAETVPIGWPLPNLRLHLLDGRLQAVPAGVAGELCVSGVGVARGYLGRPELTAERFVPEPCEGPPVGGEPGSRLYRTGDLARLRPDGALEFLGRLDQQVKIRGFRIEPQEIAAALERHAAVREAVVLAREGAPGEQILVAYAVTARPRPELSELRQFLARALPEHMVPAVFVLLDQLPLTPSGKLDRNALPAPQPGGPQAAGGVAPRDPVEATVALIWGELLAVAEVGAHDSFFELGGHSLLATQVVSRVREAFGVELSLRTVFEAPTPATLARRIEEARRRGQAAAPPIAPVPRGGRLPPSFPQQRLWFIAQLVPDLTAYNLPVVLRFRGALDGAALTRTVDEIVRRHEALRTVFAEDGGEVAQIVLPARRRCLALADLGALPEPRRDPEARRLAAALVDRPFDLGRGPLFRAVLLRCEPSLHLGVLNLHHIVSDGWSSGVLRREMAVLYAAFTAGQPSPLPDLPIQYADFAAWQTRWLAGDVLESQLAYWRRQLAGLPVLALPTDRPRPAVQSFRGRRLPLTLPAGVVGRHRALASRRGITPYMTLLAAFSALLERYTEQPDLVVGSPIANRNRLEVEGLIGFFVNALVLRVDLSGAPTFAGLQQRVSEVVIAAAVYQDLPFEKLVEALQPERDLSRAPLFQVVLALQNAPAGAFELPGLSISEMTLEATSAKFDLTLDLTESRGGITGWLEYNCDLFDAPTMWRLAGHLERLLQAAAAHPERPIRDLFLWPESERHQVVVEWNDTRTMRCGEGVIPELIEARVRLDPAATAVVADEATLSYGEMNARANRLAHHLLGLGLAVGEPVAVILDRTAEMVPALLGVLKAGGAYVPLDPGFPLERVRWILASLESRVLVTRSGWWGAAAAALGDLPRLVEVVCVEAGPVAVISEPPAAGPRVWPQLALLTQPAHDPPPRCRPDDLAYVIFTSGSTGTPKGVMVRHRPVVNLIEWVNRTLRVGPHDRVLFITSLTFDLSVYDVFGLLAAGGVVRVVADRDVHEPAALARLLRGEGITLWDSAPAALQQLLPFLPETAVPSDLRLVLLSGDWIPVTLPDRLRATFPAARVIALGGATEATVWSNSFPIEHVEPHWPSIPYGRPIQNACYHVLDARRLPCPIGVPGDLCIGGGCLAAGYAGDPAQTAATFVPDPFAPEPGGRLYLTGDRARLLADGNLEFLGRRDHQVKIRGFRIELGEIETVLARHPAVGGAAVLVREDRPGDRRLVAYVATRGGETAPAGELRDHLRRTLPEYMIPVAWVFLAALPVTANGKLDRGALPPPERQQAPDRQPPGTPTEQALAAIWQEVLGVAEVCRDDNFFDLGGHSLLATRLASRLRDAFAVETRLRVLFVSPTLAAMAEQIEELLLAASSERSVDGMLDALESLDDEAAAEMLRRGGLPQSLQGGAR